MDEKQLLVKKGKLLADEFIFKLKNQEVVRYDNLKIIGESHQSF